MTKKRNKKWRYPDGGTVDLNKKGKYSPVVWNGDMYDHMLKYGAVSSDTLSRGKFSKYSKQQVLDLVGKNPNLLRSQPGTSSTNPWGLTFMANENYQRPQPPQAVPSDFGRSLQKYETDYVPGQDTYSNAQKVGDTQYFKNKYGIGGYINPYALGGQITAEIEKQEVVVPPNGIQAGVRRKYNLPTHKNATGANLISAQPGSFVVSDRLMYDDTRTMAQAYEDAGKKLDKYQKILDSPRSTPLAIKTSQRNLENIKKLQQDIVAKNQAMVGGNKSGEYAGGGLLGALGGIAGGIAGGPFGAAMSLIPVAANLIGGLSKTDKLNPNEYMNPYAGTAMAQMDNRRFNTGPALAANANSAAAAMGNVVNQGGGRGQVNANRQALLSAKMTGDASVYAQAQNANNEYAGQAAQFKAGIGQQMANTRLQIKDINDRNRAAKVGMLTTAAGQLGQFGQTQQLMANQKSRDADMMSRWKDYMDMMKTPKVLSPQTGTDPRTQRNVDPGIMNQFFNGYTPDDSYMNQMAGRNLFNQ